MKVLFIGGTGIISTAAAELAVKRGMDVTLLNRGRRKIAEGAKSIVGDIHDEAQVKELLKNREFDVVIDFVAYDAEDVKRDIRLFEGKTSQYIFISSTAAYQKPRSMAVITESTPLYNPYWDYGRNKAAGEAVLRDAYEKNGFPFTVIRPAHTYDNRKVPMDVEGEKGSFQILKRIMEHKPVILHGDGLGWWTFTNSKDTAKGIVGLFGNTHAIGEAVHILSDEMVTWNQAYEIVSKYMGYDVDMFHVSTEMLCAFDPSQVGPIMGDKAMTSFYDTSKIKRLVPDFNATIRYDMGIRETIDTVMNTPEYQILEPEFDAMCDRLVRELSPFRVFISEKVDR